MAAAPCLSVQGQLLHQRVLRAPCVQALRAVCAEFALGLVRMLFPACLGLRVCMAARWIKSCL